MYNATQLFELFRKIMSLPLRFTKNVAKRVVPKSVAKRTRVGGFHTYSQACQDIFVRRMLNNKRNGIYLEVGAYDEIDHSNTYILEKELGWSGLSIEIDEDAARDFNSVRENECVCCDATKFDYLSHFKANHFPSQIDYLSLDIEPANQTLIVLKNLPLATYRFSVITYEHDCYVSGPNCMLESRNLLQSLGYVRVVSNVLWEGRDFEDWYVDPGVVPSSNFQDFITGNIHPKDLFSE